MENVSEKVENILDRMTAMSNSNRNKIKETTYDFGVFKDNFCASFYYSHFKNSSSFIEEQRSLVGKEVYKFKKSFKYSSEKGYDLNPTYEEKETLTVEKFEKCVKEFLEYQIEYLKNDIVRNPFESGSNKMMNLQREWEVETIQKIIRDVEELLFIMK